MTAFAFKDAKAKQCVIGLADGCIQIVNTDNSDSTQIKLHDSEVSCIHVITCPAPVKKSQKSQKPKGIQNSLILPVEFESSGSLSKQIANLQA